MTQPQAQASSGLFRSRIAGTGSYLPERILTNADLEKMVDTSDAWIVERTGIRERHLAAPDQATTDLALIASQRAIAAAGITVQDIDFILVATISGDQPMPSTACILQAKLGARNVASLDVSAACSGFIYAMSVADQFIKSGMYKNILVVGAETLSRYVNYKERDTCILFGDGAGAVVLQPAKESEDSKIYSSHLSADGSLGDLFILPGGGSRMPLSQAVLDGELHFVRMKGREIFKNAVRTMSSLCQQALDTNDMKIDKVDWLIPHQANLRIIAAVGDYFGIPEEKVVINVSKTGNTSAATIPIALDEAVRDGRINRGQNVLLTAFGAGLTAGSLLMRY